MLRKEEAIGKRINVHNHGYVELIDYMGSDRRILEAARVSTGSDADKGEKRDRGLIRYLRKQKHWSPFEKCVFEFKVHMPIFVARQLMRHRDSFNEFSMRYSEAEPEYFVPDEFRLQGTKNHQGSGDTVGAHMNNNLIHATGDHWRSTYELYRSMVDMGVSRELARVNLPVSMFTTVYWTVNLRSLANFLTLRQHHHAQKEIRDYADAVWDIVSQLEDFKWSMEIMADMRDIEWLFQDAIGMDKTANLDDIKGLLSSYINMTTEEQNV